MDTRPGKVSIKNIIKRRYSSLLVDIFLGISGGLLCNLKFQEYYQILILGLNVWNILMSFLGGLLAFVLFHTLRVLWSIDGHCNIMDCIRCKNDDFDKI